jgi:DNA polymerase-3 subunit alpha
MDNTDKVVVLLNEVRALGLNVLAPDVNASGYAFQAIVEDGRATSIRYGLGAVKGVGQGAVESLVEARARGGAFADLTDFCQRVDGQKINKRVLEALILSGAMDALGANRASLTAQLPDALRAAEQAARDAAAGQNDMFGAASATPVARSAAPTIPEWPAEQRLAGERNVLGHYFSGHPTALWQHTLTQLATCPIGDIAQRYTPPKARAEDDGNRFRRAPETPWTVAGQVVDVRKRGDTQAFVQIEDWSGRIEVSLFREAFVEYAPLLTRDAILIVEGGLAWDDFAGALRVRARRVLTLNEACERSARVLQIRLNGVDAQFTEDLRGAISGYRGGQTPLRLHYTNAQGNAVIELGPEWRVRATADLKRALDVLPGVKSTDWVLGKPAA